MECFLQYWDNLDDLYWSMAAQRERLIAAIYALVSFSLISSAAWAGYRVADVAPMSSVVVCVCLSLLLLGSRRERVTPATA